MSCGCSNTSLPICGCGSSSCNSCDSCTPTICEQVIYSGPNLVCSGIDNNDNFCVALQKLDDAICNIPSISITASNGLYRTGNNIRMGGTLIEPTIIVTSIANVLGITGLVSDPNPDFILTQTTIGVVRKTPTSTLTSSILALITADNGITKTGNNIQLGGTLIKPTTITTTSVNTLSVPGLVNNPTATYVVTIDNTTGLLTKSALSAIIPSTITADNGLTKTLSNIQLGGLLIKPTTISTTITNTLAIQGLVVTTSPDYILTETNSDVVQKISTATLTSNILSNITADNGLTKTSNNIQLGGPLIKNTNVSLAGFTLTLKDNGAAPTGIEIIPGAADPLDWTTKNVNILSGKIYGSGLTWLTNNVGVGIQPIDSTTNPGTPKLNVLKVVANGTTNTNNSTSASNLTLPITVTSLGSTNKYIGSYSVLDYRPGANITVGGGQDKFVSASFHEFIFEPNSALGDTISNGKISALAARGYFVYGRDLDSFSVIRIANSVRDSGNGYTGTIGELIGLKIEDQRADGVLSLQINKTYGIKQIGIGDTNYFNGVFQLPSSNVSIGTATLVGGTKTIATSAIKTGSKVFLSVNTPGGTQGFLSAPAASIVDSTSFVINSTSVTDTSTVNWWIINN